MSATKPLRCGTPAATGPVHRYPAGGGYVFASESCALDAAGATLLRDVEPGEIVVADQDRRTAYIRTHCGPPRTRCACLSSSTLPARTASSRAARVHEARKQAAASLRRSTPWRPMWSSACRIPAWMQPWAMPQESRYSLRHGLYQKQIHWPHLHPGLPGSAGKQVAHQAERHFLRR